MAEPKTPAELRPAITAGQSIEAVMKAVDRIAKGERNRDLKFAFRGIDAVQLAVGGALREVGGHVSFDVEKIRRRDITFKNGGHGVETLVKVRLRWHGNDGGEPEVFAAWGESTDSSDKGVSQATSVAIRNIFLHGLVVPSGDPDPDEYSTERGASRQAPASRERVESLGTLGAEIIQLLPGRTRSQIDAIVRNYLDKPEGDLTLEDLQSVRDRIVSERAAEPPHDEIPDAGA